MLDCICVCFFSVHRLNSALSQYQYGHHSQSTSSQVPRHLGKKLYTVEDVTQCMLSLLSNLFLHLFDLEIIQQDAPYLHEIFCC